MLVCVCVCHCVPIEKRSVYLLYIVPSRYIKNKDDKSNKICIEKVDPKKLKRFFFLPKCALALF